ncbi:MAG TPA: sulfite oxidase [Acidimicrobiia bacterium]|nr:sulfite oxidase [Acidimicrobiia bacterium]
MTRLAEPGEGITFEELRKATRNRGMPLEALALDITPVGMHYLLVHFDIPLVDTSGWSLRIGGNVASPLDLSLDDLRSMPQATRVVTLECAGNGRTLMEPRPVDQPWGLEAVSTAEWTGVPLRSVLDLAKPGTDTVDVVFQGADRGRQSGIEDHYRRALSLQDAMGEDVLLAHTMNGRPLEPQNGAPMRLIVPGWYGMAHVKWLTEILVSTERFDGIQHDAYRYRQSEDDPGEPVTRIRVRSLMIPPGIPESFTRRRHIRPGAVHIRGRAWSGAGTISQVEVAVNGSWHPADVAAPDERWAWQGWSWTWDAEPGEYTLACRATDTAGNVQPMDQVWNLRGVGNNAVQQVAVTVAAGPPSS